MTASPFRHQARPRTSITTMERVGSHRAPRTRPRIFSVLIATVAALVLTAAGATAVNAYWGATGTGTGTGLSSATVAAVTVGAGTPSTTLRPGTTVDVTVPISNPNTFNIRVATVSLDTSQGTGGFTIDTTHASAGCTVAAAALTFTPITTGWSVAGGNSPRTTVLPASLTMGAGANNACQGATITIYIKAS